jgi:serine/threonine protein kinase
MSAIKEYEVEKKVIGSGTSAFVKKAKRKEDGKEVAIKFLKYNTEEKLNSFFKEVNYNI